jgi:hypothetical protein
MSDAAAETSVAPIEVLIEVPHLHIQWVIYGAAGSVALIVFALLIHFLWPLCCGYHAFSDQPDAPSAPGGGKAAARGGGSKPPASAAKPGPRPSPARPAPPPRAASNASKDEMARVAAEHEQMQQRLAATAAEAAEARERARVAAERAAATGGKEAADAARALTEAERAAQQATLDKQMAAAARAAKFAEEAYEQTRREAAQRIREYNAAKAQRDRPIDVEAGWSQGQHTAIKDPIPQFPKLPPSPTTGEPRVKSPRSARSTTSSRPGRITTVHSGALGSAEVNAYPYATDLLTADPSGPAGTPDGYGFGYASRIRARVVNTIYNGPFSSRASSRKKALPPPKGV